MSKGDVLGIVASSGCSSGPHLHFEVEDPNQNLIDPFAGPCNSLNGTTSWWANQKPYEEFRITKIMTNGNGMGPELFNCPTPANKNIQNIFNPWSTVCFTSFLVHQQNGQTLEWKVYKPDNSLFTFNNQFLDAYIIQSLWVWCINLDNTPGLWRLEVTLGSQTEQHNFRVGALPPCNQDFNALVSLFNATDGFNWTNRTNWDPTGLVSCDPCTDNWFGISCTGGRVTSISLDNNNLNGVIPIDISNLSQLTTLNLSGNSLSGEIPGNLGLLTQLQLIQFGGNSFTGRLPVELYNLPSLSVLELQNNQLQDFLHPSIGNLGSLTSLNLSNNQLYGCLPPEMIPFCPIKANVYLNNTNLSEQDFTTFCDTQSGLCEPNCIAVINLNSDPVVDETFQAFGFINSSFSIKESPPPLTITFKAGEEIRLNPNFEVGLGSTFTGLIENCLSAALNAENHKGSK